MDLPQHFNIYQPRIVLPAGETTRVRVPVREGYMTAARVTVMAEDEDHVFALLVPDDDKHNVAEDNGQAPTTLIDLGQPLWNKSFVTKRIDIKRGVRPWVWAFHFASGTGAEVSLHFDIWLEPLPPGLEVTADGF